MKKILFYISLGVSIILLVNIINILITDLNRLTEYGYGYLVGKVILLVIFGTIMLVTRKYKTESKTKT
jgi:inner membrane protein involved in colicin E2 resistance